MVKYADIKVGYDCNNDCIHCVIADQRKKAKELRGYENRTKDEYFEEILESKNNGCTSITVTGGEPTIRPDFIEIIKFAKEQNLRVLLQSNARLFSSKTFLEKSKNYIDAYMIALHGSKSEIHEQITRTPNSFKQVISALENIVQITNQVGVKVVISNYNYKDLLNILKLVKSLGVEYVNIAFPHPNGNALDYFEEVVPKYSDIKIYIEECIEWAEQNNFILDFEAILPCALDKEYKLKYFLDMKLHINQGELKQLDEITGDWNKLRVGSKKKGLICTRCIYNSFCEGYWKEYIEKIGFTEFKPIIKIPQEFKEILKQKLNTWKK